MNKAKKIISVIALVAGIALSGCSSLTNLTPERVPENPSRTYTLSMSAYINDGAVVKGSIKPYIVIDEQEIPMTEVRNVEGDRLYEYDYVMPKGRTEAKYYFVIRYQVNNTVNDTSRDREITSRTVYTLDPVSRYIVSMQNERGPVGSVVPVLGRGFDKEDKIVIGGVEADTEYLSRTTLNFIVPPLEGGKNYDVEVVGRNGTIWVGSFRVDTADMNVSPSSIELAGGDITTMIFSISFSAPEGGFPIDVKTNIPSSIVMDEVVVPAGQNSVSVTVKGAAEGKGSIYVNAPGFRELVIPATVLPADSNSEVLNDLSEAAKDINAAGVEVESAEVIIKE